MLRIKEIAKEKGIALNDLANMLGITYQALKLFKRLYIK